MKNDTIAAIITPIGTGGVAAIRLSGPDSLKIAKKMYSGEAELTPRLACFGSIKTQNFTDEGLTIYFKAPNSFTGEEVVEFFVHGGTQIAKGVLEECLYLGARMAQNGEFSKRAVLNGKLNLSQAEGIADMINAITDAQVRAGHSLYKGVLSKKSEELQNSLLDVLAQIEAVLDYPEEIDEKEAGIDVKAALNEIKGRINALLSTKNAGMLIKNGVNVALVGRPNAGKSSLLNALLGFDRSIVTEELGTTRDVVKESFSYRGVLFNLSDTAGLRHGQTEAERLGVERTYVEIESADLVVLVLDGGHELFEEDKRTLKLLEDKKHIIAINKIDLGKGKIKIKGALEVSAQTGAGIVQLKEAMFEVVLGGGIIASENIITNMRHAQALSVAHSNLSAALERIDAESLDCLSIYVRAAYEALGEITGKAGNEEVLDAIFSKFCLGK